MPDPDFLSMLPPLKKGGWGGFCLCALGAALFVGLIVNVPAHAAGNQSTTVYTTIILPTLNLDIIRTGADGNVYSNLFPSSQIFAGIPFQLQTDAIGSNAFWIGQIDIEIGVFGVGNVYTLINTGYGSHGAQVGSITFTGSEGDSYKVDLIPNCGQKSINYNNLSNVNVRDYYAP
ncbi:MAG: hypothetical protein KDJ28_17805, partial [Candidatus Competibacteraceae bacterium]|nr:hypothetical protein [Candidatus Competibacteraceae bacterium]